MLGRHHISVTIGTILPFLVPLFFMQDNNASALGIYFLIAVFIGSLVPDSDCGGNATIYYRFRWIDYYMKKVAIKLTILLFHFPKLREMVNADVESFKEHRGIMHSPIGILSSSLILTLTLMLIALTFGLSSFKVSIVLFSGVLVGQFMHLLEDSCTIAGINWGFPFKNNKLSGNIYTFCKYYGYVDIRPALYTWILYIFSAFIIFLYAFNKINYSLWLVYLLIFVISVLLWIMFLALSGAFGSKRETLSLWKVKNETVSKFKKLKRQFVKQNEAR